MIGLGGDEMLESWAGPGRLRLAGSHVDVCAMGREGEPGLADITGSSKGCAGARRVGGRWTLDHRRSTMIQRHLLFVPFGCHPGRPGVSCAGHQRARGSRHPPAQRTASGLYPTRAMRAMRAMQPARRQPSSLPPNVASTWRWSTTNPG